MQDNPYLNSQPDDVAEDSSKRELMEYLDDGHRQFGMTQIGRVQAVGYFLPLLHEVFGGGESKTKLTFTILHTLMIDDRVRWTRHELDELFHWIKDGHRNYLLLRLSNVGWLEYYRDQSAYMISDKGEALMRILSRFAMGEQLVANEGAALAEIEFSLLLDLDDLPDRLRFLRNRLMKHSIRAEHALNSESAYRILEIYEQLKSAYRWAEQTRQTLDHIQVDDEEVDQWEAIRSVHDHLSQLHSLISNMQLTLQDIQRKQIDIAKYGITQLDIDHFLINSNVDELSDMLRRNLGKIPHPFLVLEDNLFSEASDVINRDRSTDGDGRGWDTELSDATPDTGPQTAVETADFVRDLKSVGKKWTDTTSIVSDVPWDIAAYRFAIMTLLSDFDERMRAEAEGMLDPVVNVPLEITFSEDNTMDEVEYQGETRSMTQGKVRRLDLKKR